MYVCIHIYAYIFIIQKKTCYRRHCISTGNVMVIYSYIYIYIYVHIFKCTYIQAFMFIICLRGHSIHIGNLAVETKAVHKRCAALSDNGVCS